MMTSLERFNAALAFRPVDRAPADLHNFMMCAAVSGLPFDRFVLDPQAMARTQIQLHEEFRQDVLLVENGTASLAQAMGCRVDFRSDDPPVVTGPAIRSLDELEKLSVSEELLESPLLKANLETVRILREHFGDRVVIMGRGDQGPFSLASQILGMEEMLMALADDEEEEAIHRLLDICTRAGALCCKAMLDAGAHCTSIGDSTAGPDVISPAMYERFAFPYEKALIDLVHRHGGRIALHICGNATRIIPKMVETGADILELDQKTDLKKAFPLIRNRAVVLGQISPITLMNGDTQEVERETQEMLQTIGGAQASGVILGPGCALGGTTPYANVHAMLQTVQKGEDC